MRMLDAPTLMMFIAATAAVLLVPGPSVLFIVARTLEHGRRGGLVSMLGVEAGALLHVGAATMGVSASKMARISPLTRLYLPMSGVNTTALGHKSAALNIGIAERTPNLRAM